MVRKAGQLKLFLQMMQHWIAIIPPLYLLISQIFLTFLVTLLVSFAERLLYRFLMPRLKKTRRMWDDVIVHSLHKPLVFLIWIAGITYAGNLIRAYYKSVKGLASIDTLLHIGIIIFIFWCLTRFIKQISERLVHPDYKKQPLDKTSVDAVSKISILMLGAITILAMLQEFGIPISAVLAFGGGSALVVGLAAKDLIANFFGGLMIYMDRPFSVGDWISSPDKEIEGTVEHIGWRLTRIRTFDQRPLYVPNSIFSTVAIENPSRMTNRRIKAKFGVRYCDAPNIAAMVADIEDLLRNHPEIDTRKTLFVKVVELGDSSINILVYTFTKTTQWVKFQAIQEDIFMKMVEIIYDKYKAEMSPTTYYLDMRGGLPIDVTSFPQNKQGKNNVKLT